MNINEIKQAFKRAIKWLDEKYENRFQKQANDILKLAVSDDLVKDRLKDLDDRLKAIESRPA